MPNSRISFTPMGTFISSSPIAKATPNAKGDETVNSFQQMLAQANSGQPNTSPVLDMRLLNALMNSQQSKYFVEDNSGQLMTSLSAGNIGNHFNFSQIQSQLANSTGYIISSVGELNDSDIDGLSSIELADALINQYGSGGRLCLSDIEHAYKLDDPSVSQDYIKATKQLVDADWNAISGGSDYLTRDQLATAIERFVL